MRSSWVVLASALALGCATEGDGAGGGRVTGPQTPSNPDGTAGTSGTGTDGSGSGTDSFGNPTGPAPNMQLPTMDANGEPLPDPLECVVGQFCEAKSPDPDNCGTLAFEPDVEVTRTPGNLLVIFDQSGSMNENWPGSGSKLQAAQTALVNALTPLQNDLTVGAIFFPTQICVLFPPMGGSVAPITDTNLQIPFQPGPDFLTAWNQHWTTFGGGLGVGTPMQEAFDRADVAIQEATLDGPLAVVAFTDGEPNCVPTQELTGIPTDIEPNRAASWLSGSEIKTYMVGLPGAQDVPILNQVAVSGGTQQYILPDDPAALEAKLAEVVQETVKTGFNSCSMTIDPIPDVPEELLMIVEEPGAGTQQVPRDRGWSLSVDPNEARVEITGSLCDAATGGRFSSITFQYACPEAPPPPPLPPLE